MVEEPNAKQPATSDAAAEPPVAQPAAAATPQIGIGLATDGAYYLIAGQFPTRGQAEAAYAELADIERRTSLRIDGVVLASSDANGKITLHELTDHSTKTGLKWGIVGGAVIGVLFPPSILAGAVGMGVVGSVLGKIRNVGHRGAVSDELTGIIQPNTTGLIVFAEDTAVVEIEKALSQADQIVSRAIDRQVAAEIDREAEMAKQAIGIA
jgi:uncharacterized membrane protein